MNELEELIKSIGTDDELNKDIIDKIKQKGFDVIPVSDLPEISEHLKNTKYLVIPKLEKTITYRIENDS